MNWYKTAQKVKVKKLTYEEVRKMPNFEEYWYEIRSEARNLEHWESDGWRCDFCEPNCTCDDDYLEELAGRVQDKFPAVPYEIITDDIFNAKGS